MQVTGTIETKARTIVYDTGGFRGVTDFMIESDTESRPAPRAYLVHQQANWTLRTHFHLEEQFQVVVGGSGSLGPHALTPICIHYASREAGYGPLVAGPVGLDYLTLRCAGDLSVWYLPEQRARMSRNLRKRQEHVGPISVSAHALMAARTQASIEELIAPDGSGLAAWLLRVAPGTILRAPEQENSGGRYHVVIGGALVQSNTVCAPGCIFTSAEEAPLSLQADGGGLEVLVLQYPALALMKSP